MIMVNENVDVLLGNPKRALIKFAIPMLVSMLVLYSYNLIDTIFVAGLGSKAMAAMSLIAPMFIAWMGLTNGLSAGATAVVSRFIGEGDKSVVDNAASQIMVIGGIISIVTTVLGFVLLKPTLLFLGADELMDLAYAYGSIFIFSTVFAVFDNLSYGILRGEGNIKKTTYAMALGAILNTIMDPIFIYKFNIGISGAAWSSMVSFIIVNIILFYWLATNSYVKLRFNNFSFNTDIIKKFMLVGLPVAAEYVIVSLLCAIINSLLLQVDGPVGVAIYGTGWQFVEFTFIPLYAISSSALPIIGACFGKKDFKSIKIVRDYAILIELVLAVIISPSVYFFAGNIAIIFTYADASIYDSLVTFLKCMAFVILFTPIGLVSATVFQGLGKGIHSLILTFIRELLLILICSYFFASCLGFNELGVWIGTVVGNAIGCIFAYVYNVVYLNRNLIS
jgi:putative MATE family efflux protein